MRRSLRGTGHLFTIIPIQEGTELATTTQPTGSARSSRVPWGAPLSKVVDPAHCRSRGGDNAGDLIPDSTPVRGHVESVGETGSVESATCPGRRPQCPHQPGYGTADRSVDECRADCGEDHEVRRQPT